MCKDPTFTEHFWLMQMLGNFEATELILVFYSFCPPFLSKNYSRATERGWYLSTLQTNSEFLKKIGILLATKFCLIMNVIIARQKFSAHLIYFPFQCLSIVRIGFEAGK